MLPRLHRFYGGSVRDWLDAPVFALSAWLQMILRLRAEEGIWQITLMRLARPPAKRSEVAAIRRAERKLQRLARAGAKPPPAPPSALQSAGIKVHRIAR